VYSSHVPVAGFGGLAPNSSYRLSVMSTEVNSQMNASATGVDIVTASKSQTLLGRKFISKSKKNFGYLLNRRVGNFV